MNLVDKTQEDIKRIIINKEYDETGFLPSEGELSKKLGVSRATVRESVKSLEVRGFVKRIHGKGILVVDRCDSVVAQALSDMYEQQDVSLQDILEVRMIIDISSAVIASLRATERDIEQMEECVRIMEQGAKDEDEYVRADLKFHLLVTEATKNKTLISITKSYQDNLYELVKSSCLTLDSVESTSHFHRNILDNIKRRNPGGARSAMINHLVVTRNVAAHLFPDDQKSPIIDDISLL